MGEGGITRVKGDSRRRERGASVQGEQRICEREWGREQRGVAWEWRWCRSEGGRRWRTRKKGGRRHGGQRRSVAVKAIAYTREGKRVRSPRDRAVSASGLRTVRGGRTQDARGTRKETSHASHLTIDGIESHRPAENASCQTPCF